MVRTTLVVTLVVCASCSNGNTGAAGGGAGGGATGAGGGSGTGGGTGGGTAGGGGGTAGGSAGGTGGGSSGTCGWQQTIVSSLSDSARDVVALADQSVVVVGTVGLPVPDAGLGSSGGFAVRLNASGNVVWSRAFGPGTVVTRVRVANDGALLATGYATTDGGCGDFHGPNGVRDAFVARVNATTGVPVSTTCIGGDDDDEAFDVREVTLTDGGAALHVTGSTDTSSNGDVGPKHGGSGLNSVDLLNAFVREGAGGRSVTASCQGTVGPDEGRAFLDDGSIVGNTFGGNDGDLAASTVPPGFADLWVVRFPTGICAQQSCTVNATRISGVLGDNVFGSAPGNIVWGTTRSNDGGISCPGAGQTNATVFVAEWGAAGPAGVMCATSSGNARVEDGFVAQNKIWLVGGDVAADGVFADAGVVGNGPPRGFVLAVDQATRQTIARVFRLGNQTLDVPYGGAMRSDGCLVLVGQNDGEARIVTVPP